MSDEEITKQIISNALYLAGRILEKDKEIERLEELAKDLESTAAEIAHTINNSTPYQVDITDRLTGKIHCVVYAKDNGNKQETPT